MMWEIELARTMAFRAYIYNLKNNKAGFTGSLVGGQLISYVSRGGPLGTALKLPRSIKVSSTVANFVLEKYGAGLVAVAEGVYHLERVVTMMITGDIRAAVCMPNLDQMMVTMKTLQTPTSKRCKP